MVLCHRVPNILCSVNESKVYATPRRCKQLRCTGECHGCKTILGDDPTDIGKEYFNSCRKEIMNLNQSDDIAVLAYIREEEAL